MKLSFIEAPNQWYDRETIKVRNYGVERILSHLLQTNTVQEHDVENYDFSFFTAQTNEALVAYCKEKVELICDADLFGFSIMESNYIPSLYLAALLKQKYPTCKIIFGGAAVTELGPEIMQLLWQTDYKNEITKIGFVDFLMLGMAEEGFLKLVHNFHKDDLSSVPNLVWIQKNKLVVNTIKYPPEGWKSIPAYNSVWNAEGHYKDDHFIVLASLGCFAKCDFCTMITKEPSYIERDIEEVVKEVQQAVEIAIKRNVESIFIQPIHQNYAHRVGQLLSVLEHVTITFEGKDTGVPLLSKIHGIGITSRADTLLVPRNKEIIEATLQRYPEIHFQVFVGLENFSEEMLKEIGKEVSQKTNIDAAEYLVYLQKTYPNFEYLLSFIGLTHNTRLHHLKENLQLLNQIFVEKQSVYPVHYFFNQPLRLGVKMAKKFNIPRKRGYYLKNNFGQLREQGNFAYPKDETTIRVLEHYYSVLPELPDFIMRKRLGEALQERGIDFFDIMSSKIGQSKTMVEHFFFWAELKVMQCLLNGISYHDVLHICNKTYNEGLALLQQKLEEESVNVY